MASGKVCARPTCCSGPGYTRSEEFRVDGYCSVECRDMHESEQELADCRAELAALRAKHDTLRRAVNESVDDCTAECTDFGHREGCKTYDAAAWLVTLTAARDALRVENRKLALAVSNSTGREAELARKVDAFDEYGDADGLARLAAERDALRWALDRYGKHDPACGDNQGSCNCGGCEKRKVGVVRLGVTR